MNLYNKFLNWFDKFITSDHPYVTDMLATVEDSPYHREKNVATHTAMVVSSYCRQTDTHSWTQEIMYGAIAAAFHDVGKPRVEEEFYSKRYERVIRRYAMHEERSAAMWLDFWSKNEMDIQLLVPDIHDAYNIMVMVAYHLPFQLGEDKIRILRTHLSHFALASVFGKLLLADENGRISDPHVEKRNSEWVERHGFGSAIVDDLVELSSECDTVVMVGPPGCGKSTYIQNNFNVDEITIFSFDSIREAAFPELTTYNDKFEAFNNYDFASVTRLHEQFDVTPRNTSQRAFLNCLMGKARDGSKTLVVDNTNGSRKSRRTIRSNTRPKGVKAVVLLGSLEDIYHNNSLRAPYKNISKKVIDRMYYTFNPPLIGEVDRLELVEITTGEQHND